MGSKNVQGSDNQRGNFYTGYNVSGKANQWHTAEYALGQRPPDPPEWSGITATGGTTSTHTNPDGILYKVHTFTATGSFDVSDVSAPGPTPSVIGGKVEYLVIAGGGGGATGAAGGGGAGGYRTNVGQISTTLPETPGGPSTSTEAAFPVAASPGSYTVTVGGGGSGGTGGTSSGSSGSNSAFDTKTANGGGHSGYSGGSWGMADPGGSGGGAAKNPQIGTTVAAPDGQVQGYPGGGGPGSGEYNAGGGGGAGDGGTMAPTGARGIGGPGKSSLITGSAVLRAGGGGGSTWSSGPGSGGDGGPGGGGPGAPNGGSGTAGDNSKGAGGGGGTRHGGTGGNGGSGIVIIRYVAEPS